MYQSMPSAGRELLTNGAPHSVVHLVAKRESAAFGKERY